VVEAQQATPDQIATATIRVNDRVAGQLKTDGVPADVADAMIGAKGKDDSFILNDRKVSTDESFASALSTIVVYLKSDGVSEADAKKVGDVEIDDKELSDAKFGGSHSFASYLSAVTAKLRAEGVPPDVLAKVEAYKDSKFNADAKLIDLANKATGGKAEAHKDAILRRGFLFQVSPFWLLLAYGILSLGELMLSPMGLSLVSKVAPIRMRGLMMGGWFVATAIGNKLTMIGIYWSIWYQSKFFIVLGCMALVMAVVLAVLLKPLKKAMPGV
jgi:hypothetical protein